MNITIEQLRELSLDDLHLLLDNVKHVIIEKSLPDNPYTDLVFQRKEDIANEWMCYEQGSAIAMYWLKGENSLVFETIEHSSKYTYTKVYRLTYMDKVWFFGNGDYADAHRSKSPEMSLHEFMSVFSDDEDLNVVELLDFLSDGECDMGDDEYLREYLIECGLYEED